jgi:hypothetical protein
MSLLDTGSKSIVVYDEPQLHSYNHTNHFNLMRTTEENPSIKPMVMNGDTE